MSSVLLHSKYSKTFTIKLYIFITIVMKWICISNSMFSFVAIKNMQIHDELTSPGYNKDTYLKI